MLSPSTRKKLRRKAIKILNASDLAEAELSIVISDDDEIHSLNLHYRGIDRTTDVLSFAMQEGPGADLHPEILGDVVISLEQAERQAPGGDTVLEIVRLLIHGICHLRGYDHHRVKDRKIMLQEEARLLDKIGIDSAPYLE